MPEFDLIKQYFATQTTHRPDVLIGIGDDAAVLKIREGHELVVTTDTLVNGVHFPTDTLPYDIGYKSLAVNLSDLAAMGATPEWITLALTLPQENTEWIQAFCNGFFTLANRHTVQLIGGDLTHGPLSVTVQAMGLIPAGKAILRSKAAPGDLIYISGTLGDAGLGLRFLQQSIPLQPQYHRVILERLHRPEPRLATGETLRDLASSAIDISDGLAADLNHILAASKVGAILNIEQFPTSEALEHSLSREEVIALQLTAGDDYELCFTVPKQKQAELEKQLSALPCRYTCIGEITAATGLVLRYNDGSNYHGPTLGYQHF